MRLRWILLLALASALVTVALNKAASFRHHADAVRSVATPSEPEPDAYGNVPAQGPTVDEGRPALPGSVAVGQGIYPVYK